MLTGKQSNVSVTDIMQLNNKKKQMNTKQPLTEVQMNIPESKKQNNQDVQVTYLKDTRKTETASTAGTMNTVISQNVYKQQDIPAVVVTRDSLSNDQVIEIDDTKSKNSARSKSPSSKSHSTLSTVHENFISFKSGDSPLHTSKGICMIYDGDIDLGILYLF